MSSSCGEVKGQRSVFQRLVSDLLQEQKPASDGVTLSFPPPARQREPSFFGFGSSRRRK